MTWMSLYWALVTLQTLSDLWTQPRVISPGLSLCHWGLIGLVWWSPWLVQVAVVYVLTLVAAFYALGALAYFWSRRWANRLWLPCFLVWTCLYWTWGIQGVSVVWSGGWLLFWVLALYSLATGVTFTCQVAWTCVRGRRSHPQEEVYLILGAGLIHGHQLGRILTNRLRQGWKRASLQEPLPTILLSGGQGPDEDLAEGLAMAQALEAWGYPGERLLIEDQSKSTQENLAYSRDLLSQWGWDFTQDLHLITSDFHLNRALYLAAKIGIPARGSTAGTPASLVLANYFREWAATLALRPGTHALQVALALVLAHLTF